MTFKEVLAQVVEWLQQDGRVSYRSLKRQFDLDDTYFEDLKEGLLYTHFESIEDDGCGFRWTGDPPAPTQQPYDETDSETRFYAMLRAVILLLQRENRVTYRELKHVFALDEALVQQLRQELILKHLATDEGDKVLIWTGEALAPAPSTPALAPSQPVYVETEVVPSTAVPAPAPHVSPTVTETNGTTVAPEGSSTDVSPEEPVTASAPSRSAPEAERRQLTVMFCDLVGSTDLSGKLDPEDLREVVRAYQKTAAEVIERYDGHIAQYLGDGLLIYFGFPVAHEDDAQRAMHTGLGILDAMASLNTRHEAKAAHLAVRIGIHTGPVVVGEMGDGDRHENLALGETPNIAARLEGLARPNTVVISDVTARLVSDEFVLDDLGLQMLKGVTEPISVSRLVGRRELEPQSPTTDSRDFSMLVGRDEEIGLLLRRWEQSKEGLGQVVLLSGEAGIGKSSLVEGLRQHVRQEGGAQIVFRCSPYNTNSILYPVIDCIRRSLHLQHHDPSERQLAQLEQAYQTSSLPLAEIVPLMAALLSVPLPEGRYAELNLSPQQQRQQTLDTIVVLLQEESERHPLLAVWEDLHWADPTTLELLGLLNDQAPTAPMLHVLTYRPAFAPSWPTRSHMTPLTLNHLERPQVEAMLTQLTQGKALPADVIQHIVAKTDGVPLFVEELTKMLLDSELLRERDDRFELTGPLVSVAIPDTLQDSLMARLDRLPMAREIAQFGAVLGREFAYDMLQAIVPLEREVLEQGLSQLVDAELLYQRGRPPRARYVFKHALIQDAAYNVLLKSRRHQLHQQVAQLLETRFAEMTRAQPELVAHHYTEAGLHERAVANWRQCGAQAMARSAHHEAVVGFERALDDLAALPNSRDTLEQGIDLRLELRNALLPLGKHERMREHMSQAETLAETLDDAHRLGLISSNMCIYFLARGDHDRAAASGHRALDLALNLNNLSSQAQATTTLSLVYRSNGDYGQAIDLARQAVALLKGDLMYESFGRLALPSVTSRFCLATCLAMSGEFTEASTLGEEAVQIAETIAHPYNLVVALNTVGELHYRQGNVTAAIPLLERSLALCQEEEIELHMSLTIALLGAVYARSGRLSEARSLLGLIEDNQVLETDLNGGLVAVRLSEIALLTEPQEAACDRAEQALAFVTDRGERGDQAWGPLLLGEIAMHRDGSEHERAEGYYRQALTLADELGIRPIQAHCHFGLGQLYVQASQTELAKAELTQALHLYREMEMTVWLPETESALAELNG